MVMKHETLFPTPPDWAAHALVSAEAYDALVALEAANAEEFWRRIAARLDWIEPFSQVKDVSFNLEDFRIRWFADGKLNVSANCIDRHLAKRANEIAIIWEGDDPAASRKITYRELYEQVCRMANVLKKHGVKKGDRVTLYLPMIPEAAYAMLACARIGAVHSAVFAGFSPDSLAGRVNDCDSAVIITADEGVRGGKRVPLKANVDAAMAHMPDVRTVLVVSRTGADVEMQPGRDFVYEAEAATVPAECPPEVMGAEDPLFILYTSGSTGKPKGVLHTTGGYLTWASWTQEIIFDHRPGATF